MMRTTRGHLTDVYNGTKFMYVETGSPENNQLPRNAYISVFNCVIYHEGQKENEAWKGNMKSALVHRRGIWS